MKRILISLVFFSFFNALAQDNGYVPVAKTLEEVKAERKKKSVKQQIEEVVPVTIQGGPKVHLNLPGNTHINSVEDAKKFMNETIPNLADKGREKGMKLKKAIKTAQLEVFDGKNYEKYPIEKRTYQRGSNSRLVYQVFYVLKQNQSPNPYLRNIFWYNEKTNKIVEATSPDLTIFKLMHGPFKEYRGETVVKEGAYFLGAKHGRWVEYDKDYNLTNKEYYNKGFYADSEISYYDGDSLKIKEVVPVIYGKKTGNYLRFYEDGSLAEEGKLDNGKKVNKWIEYIPGGKRRKKETQYPADCYDDSAPVVLREYDNTGKLIYEKPQ